MYQSQVSEETGNTLSALNIGNLMLGRGYTDDEKDEKRSRAGGVNEQLETAENHHHFQDCRNTKEKWYYRKSGAWDTWGELEPQQGLPGRDWVYKGGTVQKELATPKTQPLPETAA